MKPVSDMIEGAITAVVAVVAGLLIAALILRAL